ERARSGAGCRPAASSTLRTEVGETVMRGLEFAGDPAVAPVGILPRESQDQTAQRMLERRPAGLLVRIRTASSDELAVPRQQRLWLHWEARPRGSRQRATQRGEQRAVNSAEAWTAALATQDRQLVSQEQNLELLRARRPGQQRHQRE